MKKLINRAFLYTLLGLAAGVFYREFTKGMGFTGRSSLALLHPHLLGLGALLLLIAALFARQMPLTQEKHFSRFLLLHTIGLPLTALMMLARGVLQVLGSDLSRGLDAAISGVAGLGHLLLGAALVFFFLALKKATQGEAAA
ncbi:MAG: DUF2871 family protein [Clostridiales bacterium]|nr:DUF2871 family protein [Clostridiales bacterium]